MITGTTNITVFTVFSPLWFTWGAGCLCLRFPSLLPRCSPVSPAGFLLSFMELLMLARSDCTAFIAIIRVFCFPSFPLFGTSGSGGDCPSSVSLLPWLQAAQLTFTITLREDMVNFLDHSVSSQTVSLICFISSSSVVSEFFNSGLNFVQTASLWIPVYRVLRNTAWTRWWEYSTPSSITQEVNNTCCHKSKARIKKSSSLSFATWQTTVNSWYNSVALFCL